MVLASIVVLFIFTIWLTVVSKPKVEFFPMGDPNFVYVYMTLPVGTDIEVTDSLTGIIENKVMDVLGEDNPMVESVISNVGIGAGDPFEFSMGSTPHKGKVTVSFVEYQYRNSQSTRKYLDQIREAIDGIPGATISVEQENMGPPTGKPVNIEISGDDCSIDGERRTLH